jgi:3',5'-nucleoside bisphosphate phosphatase
MKYYYDLHIHSVLSPCADTLMTPNNIFNMASLKGLNIIAVTDHNSLKQLSVCEEISNSYDMLFIPGVEVSVKEGYHVLCYFMEVKDALQFDCILENYIEQTEYDASTYGEQEIVNIHDEVIATYPYHLSLPAKLTLDQLKEVLNPYPHLLIYAHLDRPSYSGLSNIIVDPLDGIELTVHASKDFINLHHLNPHKVIYNSDAHQITDIQEKGNLNQMDLESLTIEAFFKYFEHG